MIQITAQLENNLAALAGDQLPFVASLALNKTAVGARDLVRGNLPTRFKLRNNWTRNGIQAQTSSKRNLVARVMAPGYMEIQEDGGDRRPIKSKMLAAPSEGLQATNRVIPKAKRPRALLNGKGFIIGMRDGEAGIFQRAGKRGKIKLMYWLDNEQSYEERFEFEDDVRATVQANYSDNFIRALMVALK